MKNISNSKEKFSNERYADHQALPGLDSFYKDKIYLYKIYKLLRGLEIKDRGSTKILEVGCADGSFLKILKDDGYDTYGIDVALKAVAKAQKYNINARQANVEKGIPFDDNYFSVIIAAEVIEHLYDTDKFLKELYRAVKPGGWLLISTPNLASLKNRLRLLIGKYPQYSEYRLGPNDAGHIRNYTVSTLVSHLKSHGWCPVKVTSPNILCPMTKPIPKFIKRTAIFLGDVFYTIGSHIVIMAKK